MKDRRKPKTITRWDGIERRAEPPPSYISAHLTQIMDWSVGIAGAILFCVLVYRFLVVQ